jgi:hypothetical protein
MNKKFHIGLIVQSKSRNKINQLLESYVEKVRDEFHASAPAKEKLVGEKGKS